jgi:hypothetical protein
MSRHYTPLRRRRRNLQLIAAFRHPRLYDRQKGALRVLLSLSRSEAHRNNPMPSPKELPNVEPRKSRRRSR